MTDLRNTTEINLNHTAQYVNVASESFGKTTHIPVKLGQRHYYVDINKNCDTAFVDFYHRTPNGAKYGNAVALTVIVRNDALLDRKFFEHIVDIAAAQKTVRAFSSYIR